MLVERYFGTVHHIKTGTRKLEFLSRSCQNISITLLVNIIPVIFVLSFSTNKTPVSISFLPLYILFNRVFTNYTKMPILASEALPRENKKSSDKMLPPVEIEPGPLITSDSKSNTLLSQLVRHVLLRRSLNFCSCTM